MAKSTATASGPTLVIVESPAKAKTINKYLGGQYMVKASVGHVRDLPSKNPKGVRNPVPGVDLENGFEPSYEISPDKKKVISELKRLVKNASQVYLATDLDREGEAIAWHLTQALGLDPKTTPRVEFNEITKVAIQKAFTNPRTLDIDRVDAQQARRILDRIVGYMASPFLWKKVARGLSAGRVQSVAVRLLVEREREIRAFEPDESWQINGCFGTDLAQAGELGATWQEFLQTKDGRGKLPTQKKQSAWLAKHCSFRAELVKLNGKKFNLSTTAKEARDLEPEAIAAATAAGLTNIQITCKNNEDGKGLGKTIRTLNGTLGAEVRYLVDAITSKPTKARPWAPFITSTLQMTASSMLSMPPARTMRAAQKLYEAGHITYMRTDSTNLSPDAIASAREFIQQEYGEKYLPEKANYYASTNKDAQEAHEAIRPTNVTLHPDRIGSDLGQDERKVYGLIWKRFVACQMTPAQWENTTVMLKRCDQDTGAIFKASGRVLVFDGFYRASGVPGDEAADQLPVLQERSEAIPFDLQSLQKFSTPPSRYSEASLVKKLEEEGIGRPSTYASIIETIKQRKYVEAEKSSLRATDIGEAVTDKLIEAFPKLMELGYTRYMEDELDDIATGKLPWRDMLSEFYVPFSDALEHALENAGHARAEAEPAPHSCPDCGGKTVYRLGRRGKFLSCANYPDCKYAAPIDDKGRPMQRELVDVLAPPPPLGDGLPMVKRSGRFGPFLSAQSYPDNKFIVNLDAKTGAVKLPKPPPLTTDIPCSKCGKMLNARMSKRGPWLSCSAFPKCRGRAGFNGLDEEVQQSLLKALEKHNKAHPQPEIRTVNGDVITEDPGHIPQRIEETEDNS